MVRIIWSESVNLSGGALEKSLNKVVGRIAATLEVYIATDRHGPNDAGTRHDIVDEWLEGERLIARWTAEDHNEAMRMFGDLISRAPNFAPPFASFAQYSERTPHRTTWPGTRPCQRAKSP